MQTVISILPLVVLFFYYVAMAVLHAAYIKISADLLRGMGIQWRDAFRFALGLMAIMIIIRSVALALSLSISTGELAAIACVLNLSVGSWFLGVRVVTQQNQPAGWQVGLLISTLAFVFLVITIMVANGLSKA